MRRKPAAAEDGGRAVRQLLRHPLRRAAAPGAGVRRAAPAGFPSCVFFPFALTRTLAKRRVRPMKQEADVDPPPRDSDESSGEDRETEATVAEHHAFPAVNKRR